MIARYIIHHMYVVDLLCLLVIPLLLLALCWLVGRCVHRRRRGLMTGLVLALLAAGGYLYGTYVGCRQLEVRPVELAFADLPSRFDGYRIVQISDIHAGTIDVDFLGRAVDTIRALKPDLIVVTGDMVNAEPQELQPYLRQLGRLKATDGVCAVLGNHDYGDYSYVDDYTKDTNLGRLESMMVDMKWTVLMNSRRIIRRDDQRLVVAGMENDGEGRFPALGDIGSTLWRVGRQDFVVMLEHDPTSWRRKILRHCHAQLTLSGHTHGGQLSLLGWSPAALRYHEYDGVYWMGDRCLNVTRGLSGAIPFRLGATPEVVVITLKKK